MRRGRVVAGSKIHIDASLVDANASLHSVKPLEAEVVSAIEPDRARAAPELG
jgi:hypothetical protein